MPPPLRGRSNEGVDRGCLVDVRGASTSRTGADVMHSEGENKINNSFDSKGRDGRTH